MKKHQIVVLLIVICMLTAMLLPGCATTAPTAAPTVAPAAEGNAEPPVGALEPYTFTHYFNYDWWTIHPWAEDEVSKYYQKKYNVTVEFSKPDSDPRAKLNVMLSSGDLPDAIMMDRGEDNINMAKGNFLLPLEPFMAKNKNLEENVLPNTIKLLQIDGKLYGIPNWPRKAPTGGNDAWIYDTRLYAEAGSPDLSTLEKVHDYAMKIKTEFPKNKEGLDTIPVAWDTLSSDQARMIRSFYRSYGGFVTNGWYSVSGGKYQNAFRDPVFKEAAMALNQWYRDGLIPDTQFSDTEDQIVEKLVAGRVAIAYYDHSKNETKRYRTLLMQGIPGDSFEIVKPFPYPPAKGLPTSKIYADHKETVGWNVTCITNKAKDPQRIFDLYTDFLTLEGSIIMMYGPKGPDFNWETLDAEGLPVLKKAESELSEEEYNKLGCWFWSMPGQSDNVDNTKFAVNAKLPLEKQNWVITQQATILTPIMFIDDEFVGIAEVIDGKSTEGVNRTLCREQMEATMPKIITADSAEKAAQLYDELVKFLDDNGMAAIESAYDAKWKANVAIVGSQLTK